MGRSFRTLACALSASAWLLACDIILGLDEPAPGLRKDQTWGGAAGDGAQAGENASDTTDGVVASGDAGGRAGGTLQEFGGLQQGGTGSIGDRQPSDENSRGGAKIAGLGGDVERGGAATAQAGEANDSGSPQVATGGLGGDDGANAGTGGTASRDETGGAAEAGGAGEGVGTAGSAGLAEGGTAGTAGSAGALNACEGVDLSNDTKNCGWCGHDCRSGPCTNGMCSPTVVDASSMGNSGDVVLADSLIFWSGHRLRWSGRDDPFQNVGMDTFGVSSGVSRLAVWGDTVYVALTGSSTPIFGWRFVSGEGELTRELRQANGGFAVDDTGIYWGSCQLSEGTLHYAPHGNPTQEVTVAAAVPCSFNIRLDGEYLWFTSIDSPGVFRIDKTARGLDGSQLSVFRTVAAKGTLALLVDSDYVYAGTWDHADIYDETPSDGIVRFAKDGSQGTETLVVSGTQWRPRELAVDDGYLYWTNLGRFYYDNTAGGGSVNRVCLSCSNRVVEQVADEPTGQASGLAIDDEWIYWVAKSGTQDVGQLKRTPK